MWEILWFLPIDYILSLDKTANGTLTCSLHVLFALNNRHVRMTNEPQRVFCLCLVIFPVLVKWLQKDTYTHTHTHKHTHTHTHTHTQTLLMWYSMWFRFRDKENHSNFCQLTTLIMGLFLPAGKPGQPEMQWELLSLSLPLRITISQFDKLLHESPTQNILQFLYIHISNCSLCIALPCNNRWNHWNHLIRTFQLTIVASWNII